MSCQQLRYQMIESLDQRHGELSDSQLEEHLNSCSSCRLFWEEQLEICRLLEEALPDLEPSPRIWQKLEATLVSEKGPGRRFGIEGLVEWFRVPGLRPLAAAVILVMVVSLALLRLPAHRIERNLLAQLESYQIEIRDNPFLRQAEVSNPFVDLSARKGNPFESVRSQP